MLIKTFYEMFCMEEAGAAGAPAAVTTDTNSNASAAATVSTTVGEAAKVAGSQVSAAATVPSTVGQQTATGANDDFRAGWPDEMKNDPYLNGFKDTASLAKALIDNKRMAREKMGIPGKDATPEQRALFEEAMGIPKEPAGYEFKAPDNLPEALKSSYDQAHADKWAAKFKELGIPKEAANALRNELFGEIMQGMGEFNAEAEKSDAEFQKLAVSIYGDDNKASAALQNARTVIERNLPPALKDAMNQLSNTALLAVAAAISGETKHLTGEDKSLGTEGATSDGRTIDQLREEARQLQSKPEYNSPFTDKGKGAHEEVVKKVQDLYARINKMAAA